jgi:hypothetical protein
VFNENYTDSARLVFGYGYLEGVEAALTKEVVDVLVPRSDRDHPVWWVLPEGGISAESFKDKLNAACKAQSANELLKVALQWRPGKMDGPNLGCGLIKKVAN